MYQTRLCFIPTKSSAARTYYTALRPVAFLPMCRVGVLRDLSNFSNIYFFCNIQIILLFILFTGIKTKVQCVKDGFTRVLEESCLCSYHGFFCCLFIVFMQEGSSGHGYG